MSKRWIVACGAAFLAAATAARAQKASNWRVYKSADGLPETYASSVTVSSRGNVWAKHLNTPLISSLDGYRVQTFQSPGIGGNRFYESPSGQLWTISTNGLQLYGGEGWQQYAVPEIAAEFRKGTFSLFRPVPLCPVRQNRVIFLTPDALREFNVESAEHPQTSVLLSASATGLQKFSGMAIANDGGVWLTGAQCAVKIKGPLRSLKSPPDWREFTLAKGDTYQNLRDPVDGGAGGLTAMADALDGSGPVLAHFDGAQWSVLASHLKNVSHAWLGLDGTVWAMTTYALLEMKPGQHELSANEELSVRRFFDCAVEPGGIFWLATSDGLIRYSPLTWRAAGDPEIKSSVRAIAEDRENVLWIAADDGVHQRSKGRWQTYAYPPGMEDSAESSLYAMPAGGIVLASSDRLAQFNAATGKFENAGGAVGRRVKALGLLKDGRLVMQTNPGKERSARYSLEVYDGARFGPTPFDGPDLDLGGELNLVFAAQNGSVWLGGSRGLAVYRDGRWQISAPRTDVPSEGIACMAEIAEGRIWCSIQDRIWEFDGRTWHAAQGGFDRINALLKSRDGSVWVGAATGLHRSFQHAWAVNSSEDGLPANDIRAICEDSEGRLWVGTPGGLSLYHPEADPDPPRTTVLDLPDAKNGLPEDRVVSVSFSAEDRWKFTRKERLLYSYRLDQQDWQPLQSESTVYFPELLPGRHYFQVRSMDRNWNLDPKPAGLEFVIVPPWYRESRLLWIGAAGLALALFFAGVAVNRHRRLVRSHAEVEAKVALRTRQLERANEELFHSQKMTALGTLAAGIAHDFNNILSIIKGSAQIIEDNVRNPEKIATRTARIKTVVEQGAGIVNAMLGFSRVSDHPVAPVDINSVVEETMTLLGDRFRRDVEVQFTPAPGLPQAPASRDFLQQILLNLIFNAAESMPQNRRIEISTGLVNRLPAGLALQPASAPGYVTVAVKDTGSGIAPEIMGRIFEPFFTTKAFSARRGTGLGLSMVYELAKQMAAGLGVESTVGKGSIFTLYVAERQLPVDDEPEKK